MAATTKLPAFLLHSVAAATMAYGFLNLPDNVAGWPIAEQVGGHWQFLTINGLFLAWLTMVVSIACDLVPGVRGMVQPLKRILLQISLPLAVVISSIYWTLVIFAPALILPKPIELSEPSSSTDLPELIRIPLNVDLALHASPAVALFLDFFAFEKRYSRAASRYGALVLAALAAVAYASWVEWIAPQNGGRFPYPFLTENPFHIRVGIYAGATSLAYLSFQALNAFHA